MNKEACESFSQMIQWCLKHKIDTSFRSEENTPLFEHNHAVVFTFSHYRTDGSLHQASVKVNRFDEMFDSYFEHRMKQIAADLIIEPLRVK